MLGPDTGPLLAALQGSLQDDNPPEFVSGPLYAHWELGKGNWARAFELLKSDASKDAAWVRAHLHRRKGEDKAAADWYRKAGKPATTNPVDQEWSEIAAGLLLRVP
jgi:hypothetical protein